MEQNVRPSRLTGNLDTLQVQMQLTLGLFLFTVGIGKWNRTDRGEHPEPVEKAREINGPRPAFVRHRRGGSRRIAANVAKLPELLRKPDV